VSRTRDLVDQIKQITIEICDIKNKKKTKIVLEDRSTSTFNVHNHTLSGHLQECHVKHDEGDVHYEDSILIVHPVPDSMHTLEHCAPTQCPSPTKPIASPPPPPEPHPSLPGSGIPGENPSRKLC